MYSRYTHTYVYQGMFYVVYYYVLKMQCVCVLCAVQHFVLNFVHLEYTCIQNAKSPQDASASFDGVDVGVVFVDAEFGASGTTTTT